MRRSLFHSGSFRNMVDFFCSLLMVQPKEGPAYERFIMQVMIFTHGVLTSKAYRGVSESLQAGPAAREQVSLHEFPLPSACLLRTFVDSFLGWRRGDVLVYPPACLLGSQHSS